MQISGPHLRRAEAVINPKVMCRVGQASAFLKSTHVNRTPWILKSRKNAISILRLNLNQFLIFVKILVLPFFPKNFVFALFSYRFCCIYQSWAEVTLVASGLYQVFLFLVLPSLIKTLEGSRWPQNVPSGIQEGESLNRLHLARKQNFFVFSHPRSRLAFTIMHVALYHT